MPPHVILFADVDFHGAHKHVSTAVPFLDDFNDVTSSFIILSGNWAFYIDANFQNQEGNVFGPGAYHWVEEVRITNDTISSLQPV